MRRLIPFINWVGGVFSATLLLMFISQPAGAWGQTGHRVIGMVAEDHLNSKTKEKLNEIMNGESLVMASTWMDEVRFNRRYRYMADWHWVTIPDGNTYAQSEKNPHGDILEVIERLVEELRSKQLTKAKEREHIKLLIHLVGDMHQPLHVGAGSDKGGNETKVKWFGKASNLHRVWDSNMIDATKLSYGKLALSLDKLKKYEVEKLRKASIFTWAKESMDLRKQVYQIGDGNLGYGYFNKNIDNVYKRLLEAGVRLAGLLNEMYG